MSTPPLLSANLTAAYSSQPPVLTQVQFTIEPGEVLGLVGASGSGKSTVALSLLRLLAFRGGQVSGSVQFEGRELLSLPEREMRALRGNRLALVPQSPAAALNPLLRLRAHFEEAYRAHSKTHESKLASFRQILERVCLPADDAFLDRYPAQVSVGQGQRFLIALSLLHRPALLIADEPTSALDVITQAEILSLLRALNQSSGMAILFISHDLLSIASLCHRVAILEQGRLVESASTEEIFRQPRHPYTRRLVDAIPRNPWTL